MMLDNLALSPEALSLLGIILILFVYVRFIARRSRFQSQEDQGDDTETTLSETELERYARHIVLHDIGGAGQRRLKAARVLVIGAGGLSAPILSYLAAGGIGTIGVIDDDSVSLSNLQRQVLFNEEDLDQPKVFAAVKHLKAQNPFVRYRPYHRRLTQEIAFDLLADYDLVIDGCDNYPTRALLNHACVESKTPLISGAISQWEGQISLFDPANGGPCYACLFPDAPSADIAQNCASLGVMGALPGIIGALMAAEAIKYITHAGQGLRARLYLANILEHEYRIIALKPRKDCKICGESGQNDT